ncbi:MAG: 16S rRNA (cytidine(1402)-2'-O)-methyltransferase [Lachnospiraceae bacterium]|nr:16S rRNA (cytidine(1402)-2'-O)-methyltransferase [Lachnospiraceae bacterium]
MAGRLYICATPIGNLEDITLRAVETLKKVQLIAAEDTRHSKALLSRYDVHTPVTSYHEHNRFEKAEVLLERLKAGDDIALITDAGTPVISDPGEVLVARAREEGIEVLALPGPCAMIAALSVSGIPGRRFCFEGFLPADNTGRRAVLEELKDEPRTVILYEAPHHLKGTLKELAKALGERRIAVCRELTKLHEEVLTMTLPEAAAYYEENEPRGEFVLVIEGKPAGQAAAETAAAWQEMPLAEHLQYYLDKGLPQKEAMKQMAKDRNTTKREIYNELLKEDSE